MDINKACKPFGGIVAVSVGMGFSRATVANWKRVPPDHVIRFCTALDWSVTPHELRPDLYPNPADGLPAGHAARCPCECATVGSTGATA